MAQAGWLCMMVCSHLVMNPHLCCTPGGTLCNGYSHDISAAKIGIYIIAIIVKAVAYSKDN